MVGMNPGHDDREVADQTKLEYDICLNFPKLRRWVCAGVPMRMDKVTAEGGGDAAAANMVQQRGGAREDRRTAT